MCGPHTQSVVLPAPPPAPAATATFAPRLFEEKKSVDVEAGKRGRVRSINDLKLVNDPFLPPTG